MNDDNLFNILKDQRIKELDRLEINIISYVNKFYQIDDRDNAIVKFKNLLDKIRDTDIKNMKELIEFQLQGIN